MGKGDRPSIPQEQLRALPDPVALLDSIFAHSPLALQIYSPAGRSLFTNPAFRELFGSEPPPEYCVLEDEIARTNGVLEDIRRAFRGEVVSLPVTWYDPRELRQVTVDRGNRVAILATFFPLWDAGGRIANVGVVFTDVTREQLALQQAEAERDLLRLIVDQSGDAIIVADAGGVLRVFNPAAERLHGVGLREVSAERWAETYGLRADDGTPLASHQTPLARAVRGETVVDASWRVRRPDGGERWLSGTAVPLRKADGAPAGAVLIARDETERRLRDEERTALLRREQAARSEAEAATRAKDGFLAMLGHELRNPLAPVVSALELLRRRGVPWPRELEVIDRQVLHLARLVDDLLDVSRITHGKIELRRAPMEIAQAVDRALEIAGPSLGERRHHLRVEVPRRGLGVLGDETRLSQVIANLVLNAARYTDPGGHVEVRARISGPHIVVEVQDDGAGLSPELLPRLFTPFAQGQARSEGGLGLGLALARSLTQLHGGSLEAESGGPGLGSTFRVRLPSHDPAAGAAPSGRSPSTRGSASRRVLLVDDNRDAAELLAELLRLQGHEIRVAADGPTALEALSDFDPQVAVLDIGLPGMDGFDLAAELRRRLEGRIQLVSLTGYGQESDAARARAAGFAHHLVKPVSIERLLDLIEGASP